MTAYATLTDLQATGLPAKALANWPVASQQAALNNASGILDGYFKSQFSLPLMTWGYDVTQRCADIAAFLIMRSRGFSIGGDEKPIRQGYEDAIDWATNVSKRLIHPVVTDSGQPQNTPASPHITKICSGWDRML